ncbi:hypothetical protein C8Q80DRAFT_1266672 [Daedaleopsis nitida]|nr:hypothetical protein C8Q80DRAFT_1266672 [Daedaleopsis nitida]
MFIRSALASFALLVAAVRGGSIVWDGSFNSFSTVADFDKWSWASQVGTYQWYIHGSQPTSHYLALDPAYKNPAMTAETHGLKMTIDSTATWNSNMERAELIPQTTANLGTGNLFYHFSISRSDTNPPDSTLEHQIMFFESHFTELKYGVGPNATNLEWHVGGQPQWGTPLTAGTWFNFAYDIDFSAGTVGLWASTGSAPLTKVANNIKASTSTNSEDFHDWFVSGVFIENGPITTTIGSGSSAPNPPTTSAPVTTAPAPTTSAPTPPPSSTSSASGPLQTQWGQCGGTGFSGPTDCVSPFTCVAVSAPYYFQCQ